MPNKKWNQEGEYHFLYFTPFYEDEIIAVIFQDEDADWCYRSEATGQDDTFIDFSAIPLEEVKKEVEDIIQQHYADQRDYYQELFNKFFES